MTIDQRQNAVPRANHWRAVRTGLMLASLLLTINISALAQQTVGKPKTPVGSNGPLEAQPQTYYTFYYQNGNLTLEAYLYRPSGPGPFPLVIYNHGSRSGHEREEKAFTFIADILVPQGYAVLVPERRGYGKSEGKTYDEAVNGDTGQIMMNRFHNEASDVLAALDYLKTSQGMIGPGGNGHPHTIQQVGYIDVGEVGIMGWSHGGVVSLLAASERHDFKVLVDQAGGSLTWKHSPTLQNALTTAGGQIKVPAICMDAENDATTESVKQVCQAVKDSQETAKTIIYPPFTPTSNPSNVAPGHLIFGQGVSIWQQDLVDFLRLYLVRRIGPIPRP